MTPRVAHKSKASEHAPIPSACNLCVSHSLGLSPLSLLHAVSGAWCSLLPCQVRAVLSYPLFLVLWIFCSLIIQVVIISLVLVLCICSSAIQPYSYRSFLSFSCFNLVVICSLIVLIISLVLDLQDRRKAHGEEEGKGTSGALGHRTNKGTIVLIKRSVPWMPASFLVQVKTHCIERVTASMQDKELPHVA